MELYKLIGFLASDIEYHQMLQHGNSGEFLIIDDKIPCSVIGLNHVYVNELLNYNKIMFMKNIETYEVFSTKCLLINGWLKFESGAMFEAKFFTIGF